ncbi:GNAT family protein [Actinocrispum sp. NPDC049592]|uniref:GNAT family N-acetyltransferase n=1 Tax=Actinocrispum sp. NPDC049592 TaxID=3154835 RepID=UPI00343CE88C
MRWETERLVIREFEDRDAEVFAEYRSDPEVARYQSWDTPMTVAEARARIARYRTLDPTAEGWFQYAIELDGSLIGDIGVGTHQNLMQAEIGFTLAPPYQGKGYATEAVCRVVEHLFTDRGLHRLSAGCDGRNDASARLLERVGFRREGLQRQHTWIKGEWTDDLLFGLLASDYAEMAAETVE